MEKRPSSIVIPGARNAALVEADALASRSVDAAAREIYDRLIAPQVHQRW